MKKVPKSLIEKSNYFQINKMLILRSPQNTGTTTRKAAQCTPEQKQAPQQVQSSAHWLPWSQPAPHPPWGFQGIQPCSQPRVVSTKTLKIFSIVPLQQAQKIRGPTLIITPYGKSVVLCAFSIDKISKHKCVASCFITWMWDDKQISCCYQAARLWYFKDCINILMRMYFF